MGGWMGLWRCRMSEFVCLFVCLGVGWGGSDCV